MDSTARPDSSAPPSVDRYVIESLIGKGGFGEVFRAMHVHTGQRVALKVLRASAGGRLPQQLVREARIMASVRHRNIVQVMDAGVTDTLAFVAMELVDGVSLDELIRAASSGEGSIVTPQSQPTRGLPIHLAMPLAEQLLEGLAAAHAVGVVHRDIKPQNILVLGDGTLKILDFGISKASFVQVSASSQDNWAGTPGYMAPEQYGSGDVDARADIYSAGATIFRMLAGRRPFPEQNFAELLARVMRDRAPLVSEFCPDVPRAIVQALARALARDRDARFSSVQEFAQALRGASVLAHEPTMAALSAMVSRVPQTQHGRTAAMPAFTPSASAAAAPPHAANFPSVHPTPVSGAPYPGARAISSPPPAAAGGPSPSGLPPRSPGVLPATFPGAPSAAGLGSDTLASPRQSDPPVRWLLAGVILSVLLLITGGLVAAGFFMMRPAPKPDPTSARSDQGGAPTPATTFKGGVVIDRRPAVRRTGTFKTTQRCVDNDTIEFDHATFEVASGPAIIGEDNCDLTLIECTVKGQTGIQARSATNIIVRGGTFDVTARAFELTDGADLEMSKTIVNAGDAIMSTAISDLRLRQVRLTAKGVAVQADHGTFDSVDSVIVGDVALNVMGTLHATVMGGELRGTRAAARAERSGVLVLNQVAPQGPLFRIGDMASINGAPSQYVKEDTKPAVEVVFKGKAFTVEIPAVPAMPGGAATLRPLIAAHADAFEKCAVGAGNATVRMQLMQRISGERISLRPLLEPHAPDEVAKCTANVATKVLPNPWPAVLPMTIVQFTVQYGPPAPTP